VYKARQVEGGVQRREQRGQQGVKSIGRVKRVRRQGSVWAPAARHERWGGAHCEGGRLAAGAGQLAAATAAGAERSSCALRPE
jgi:hypothetical protein